MRKISANYIFPISSPPLKNGIIVLDDSNKIVDLIDTQGRIKEIQNLEFYSGMIVPGFVDVFTLLSYPTFSKNNFREITQADFFKKLYQTLIEFPKSGTSIQKGINHLDAFGTVAVADYLALPDIDNHKKKSKIKFYDHNFSELDNTLVLPFDKHKNSEFILLNHLLLEQANRFKPEQKYFNRYCIGTGSLATHQKLSVFEEIKAIQHLYPKLSYFDLLSWATINGARYLKLESEIGSIEVGKKPGLNLLTNLDYANSKIKKESQLNILL